MLKFDPRWRFKPPKSGRYKNSAIPVAAVREFIGLIEKTAVHGDRWDILEHFKGAFASACGVTRIRSSSEDWAATDMASMAQEAAKNAPLFLDAFHGACERLRSDELFTPDAGMINATCRKHRIGYEIRSGELVLRDSVASESVASIKLSPSLAESAMEKLEESWERSEELLQEGRPKEAVQEVLWVLESLTTAFRGVRSGEKKIGGKYFNDIVKDLRNLERGSTLDRVLEWVNAVHGYLSSPTGGGVRHGLDLKVGKAIGPAEGRLFCNLIRSYVAYLVDEHQRLSDNEGSSATDDDES